MEMNPPYPVSGTSERQTRPNERPIPSLMTLPGSMNETATMTAATSRIAPWNERRKLAGASGARRWTVPARRRCAGRARMKTKRRIEGTDRVSTPWTGVDDQKAPLLGT